MNDVAPCHVANRSYLSHLHQNRRVWLSAKGHACFKENVGTWLPGQLALKGRFPSLYELALEFRFVIGREKNDDDLDRKSTRLNSSHVEISYAVFCLKKKK